MLGDPLLRLTAVVAAVRRYRDELAALGGPQAEYARDLDMALANEVWDEGFPPGGLVCGTCGQPVESEPCAEHTGRTLPSDERNEHRG
ncbi:hypothetical protein GOOTI_221_00240 [Gordonia otitidis NBRC 100426]|uniref:Uncharacterized protein n=2 Tax=Gordonia otitidis TaxID=249058 RepID=H5TSM3_GORO1|nr:hypothetical protein GOOTI_221_00240 [Gordonia otitidis NBRC 100426]